jgi:hypothetical protein
MSRLLETMLFSCDFRAVDEPTRSAFALFDTVHGKDPTFPPFVHAAFESTKKSDQLNPKRAAWLVLMCILPQIAVYVVDNASSRERAVKLVDWLGGEVEKLFDGGYNAHAKPLDAFVEAAQVQYNTT